MKNTINGYIRKDGTVGVRNHVLIIPSVLCAKKVAERIAYSTPGCVVASHNQGCAQLGDDYYQTRRTILNSALNPNVASVLIVGLGCERVSPHEIQEEIRASGKEAELIMIQDMGTAEAIKEGSEIATKLVEEAKSAKRKEVPVSSLVIGVECGGSDFSSGLSANPAVGQVSDKIWKENGRVILSETTELVGAEHILFKRMEDKKMKKTFEKMLKRMIDESVNNSRDVVDQENIPNNISPGNVKGGLTTIEEKSLGAVIKGGRVPIVGVKEYGEIIDKKPGLYLMDTPGYDVESVTAMVAGGATIILFTTGQGTPTGNPIAPVIKITGNYLTAEKMKANIDFDSSKIISGESSLEECGNELYEEVLKVADGKLTKAEKNMQDDYSIWNIGIKL
ncbi:MAG: altronate dehydratase large subunit [Kosmotogales bacterium]|nr:altronate dehydratase large subunit [Kosmotogales bacterium]